MTPRTVAALYVEPQGVYVGVPGVDPWWPFPRLMEFERRDLKKWVAKKAVVQGENAPW